MPDSPYFLDSSALDLHAQLHRLSQQRIVFFAGMPGTGKSLMAHQLTHLAASKGRRVHLLQWDVARPVFEQHEMAAPYPRTNGVTDPIVRLATGLWARSRIADWDAQESAEAILIGETPFIGNRFTELARVQHDTAELVLRRDDCRFVLSLPVNEVQAHVVAERARRFETPVNPHEVEDAPPHLIASSWHDLYGDAWKLGVIVPADVQYTGRYDADTYRQIYEQLLRHRNLDLLPVDAVLPTATMSVYDIEVPVERLIPEPGEVVRFIMAAESLGPAAVERWWDV
jgi:hypothetical protein